MIRYHLIFKGTIDNVNFIRRIKAFFLRTLKSNADLSVLTGYEKIECCLQLLLIKLNGKKAAIFCDSTIHDKKQNLFKGLLKRLIFTSVDGIFGYGLRRYEFSNICVVIGFILGIMAERSFHQSLMVSVGNYSIFWSSIVSVILIVLLCLALVLPFMNRVFSKRSN